LYEFNLSSLIKSDYYYVKFILLKNRIKK